MRRKAFVLHIAVLAVLAASCARPREADRPDARAAIVRAGDIELPGSAVVAAMDAAGEAVDLSVSLADIFGGEIDFNTEVQPGDSFELLVEKRYREHHAFAGYGPILAAEFDNAGRRYRAVRFVP